MSDVVAVPADRLADVRARTGGLIALGLLVALVAAVSLAVGSRPVPLSTVLDALIAFDPSIDEQLLVRELRLPRTVLGLAVGAALALSGAVMQGLTRNPLADPGLLGINGGASLAVVTGIAAFGVSSLLGYVWFAFAGAAVAAAAVYVLGSVGRGGATPIKLAVAGAALFALFRSLTAGVMLFDPQTLEQFRVWMVGSLAGRDTGVLVPVLPFLAAGALIALGSGRALDGLAMGPDVATALGQQVQRTRLRAAAAVVLLCGGATAAAGPVAFVGLTVPHVARGVTGADHRWLLPYSALMGAVLLVGADVIGRVVARPAELPVGIVTAFIGAPVFIAFVRRRRIAEL
jgi:iron complex transport system permease protein